MQRSRFNPGDWTRPQGRSDAADFMDAGFPHSSIPLVSVLMPAYNGEKYVIEAAMSILGQTFTDFELLVIDDGSTDSTRRLLEAVHDPRLRLVSNERNLGLIATLNKGLEIAAGRYIARMDADDISLSERLEKQVQFLEAHPEVHVLGTMVNLIDENGEVFSGLSGYPTLPNDIRRYLLRECCLIHPTVMFRKDTICSVGGYNTGAKHSEDYDLWLRLSHQHVIANLPEKLVSYRIHKNQVSVKNIITQHQSAHRCRVAALKARSEMGENVSDIHPIVFSDLWRRLTAADCTLGRDYLNWANIYCTMRLPRMALGLALRSVLHSPLSINAWVKVFRSSFEVALPLSWQRAVKWYGRRLVNILRVGKTGA